MIVSVKAHYPSVCSLGEMGAMGWGEKLGFRV